MCVSITSKRIFSSTRSLIYNRMFLATVLLSFHQHTHNVHDLLKATCIVSAWYHRVCNTAAVRTGSVVINERILHVCHWVCMCTQWCVWETFCVSCWFLMWWSFWCRRTCDYSMIYLRQDQIFYVMWMLRLAECYSACMCVDCTLSNSHTCGLSYLKLYSLWSVSKLCAFYDFTQSKKKCYISMQFYRSFCTLRRSMT